MGIGEEADVEAEVAPARGSGGDAKQESGGATSNRPPLSNGLSGDTASPGSKMSTQKNGKYVELIRDQDT